jgi:hypothetical protein
MMKWNRSDAGSVGVARERHGRLDRLTGSQRLTLITVVGAALAATTGGVAIAVSAAAEPDTIKACVKDSGGLMRYEASASKRCRSNESAVTWNSAGEDGARGPRGARGADGAAGEPGADGAMGPAGPTGPAGPAGDSGQGGPMGLTGPAGPSGPAGPTGSPGASATSGITGITIATGSPIAVPSITSSTPADSSEVTATATCGMGQIATGGGYLQIGDSGIVTRSQSLVDGWMAVLSRANAGDSIAATVVCADGEAPA